MKLRQLTIIPLACIGLSAQNPQPEEFTSWINYSFSNYQPAFQKSTIRGGCKIRVGSVFFVGNFDMRGDFRKYYFREIDSTEGNSEVYKRTQEQLQLALKKWLEHKGFQVVTDESCTATASLEINYATNGGYSGYVKGSTGLYEPSNLVLHGEACYGNVDMVKAFPQAKIMFWKGGNMVKETKLLDAAGVTAKSEVNPPLKGAGLFSGKAYKGKELVNNKAFIQALGKVIEITITKCLDKFGQTKLYDEEGIDDMARQLR